MLRFHYDGNLETKTKTAVIDSSMLASLDEARVYGAASSYNWLNAKLRELYAIVQNGGRVQVDDKAMAILLDSKLTFVAWAMKRYPSAEFGQSKILVMMVACSTLLSPSLFSGKQTMIPERYPNKSAMLKFGTRSLFFLTAIIAIICGVLLPMIQSAHETARGMSCRNNLKSVGLALLNYEESYRSWPIAAEKDSEGGLWRSWRSQIYPVYLEQSPMFYDEKSSWDSATNMRLLNGTPIAMGRKDGTTRMATLERYPWAFTCPSCASNNRNGINYVVVSGELTAFPKSRSTKLSEIKDGLANTILVVESITCCPDWTEPRDLEFDSMSFAINAKNIPSISSNHPRGPLVCFADGEVYHISNNATENELRAMLTIAGNEGIDRQDLVNRGVLIGN